MQSTLVSIIIPTFNRAHLIGETLDSVLAQSYTNWECLVIDDGSSDTTATLLNQYITNDARFQYHQRPNRHLPGGNGARNYGFELSKGYYVQWFDSDDIMYTDYLQSRLMVFENSPKTDVVFCAFTYFDSKGLKKRISNYSFSGHILKDLTDKKVTYSPLSFLLKREIINGFVFDETLIRAQDLEFFFRVFSSSSTLQIRHVKEVLFKVRWHDDSLTIVTDGPGAGLHSRYIVNKKILDYFVLNQDDHAIVKFKNECVLDLKRMLDNKNYSLVIGHILKFEYFNFRQKSFLLFCVLNQIVLGRGAYRFKKVNIK
ncbi:glycosyltransferase family 2 protein [Flavobacteriaceae bacterium LMO-SS05]